MVRAAGRPGHAVQGRAKDGHASKLLAHRILPRREGLQDQDPRRRAAPARGHHILQGRPRGKALRHARRPRHLLAAREHGSTGHRRNGGHPRRLRQGNVRRGVQPREADLGEPPPAPQSFLGL